MTAKTKFGIRILLLTMLLVSVAFVPTVNADVKSNLNGDTSESNISYTASEL